MKTCFGLLGILIFCPDEQATTISDYCAVARDEIAQLRRLTASELAALQRPRKQALRNLRTYYDKNCSQPDTMKRK